MAGISVPKNIVLISIDDMFDVVRYRDAFGVQIQTPGIDALMASGVTFENAFTVIPLCSPSRTAVLSGGSPFRTGVHDNLTRIEDIIPVQNTLLGQAHEAGWYTAARGKLFHGQPSNDEVRAYLEPILDTADWTQAYRSGTDFFDQTLGDSPVPEQETYDSITGDWAADFLRAPPTEVPFFLSVGISKPHWTWDVPKAYYDLYERDKIVIPKIEDLDYDSLPEYFRHALSTEPDRHERILEMGPDAWGDFVHAYLAAVSFADAQIVKVIEAMTDAALWDSSTLLLWSDHGYHLGDRDLWRKFTHWEEATSIPLVIVDPDLGQVGSKISEPASTLDIWPTLATLSGIPAPAQSDGFDLSVLMADEAASLERAGVITAIYGSMSIRTEDARYVIYPTGEEELFLAKTGLIFASDVSGDPVHTETLVAMRSLLRKEAKAIGVDIVDPGEILLGSAQPETFVLIGDGEARGGDGDDTYHVTGKSIIFEEVGGGIDRAVIGSPDDFRLPLNIEEGVMTERSPGTLYGNDLSNTLYGNLLAARIYGNDGDDEIYGFKGNDELYGGNGNDILRGGNQNDLLRGESGVDTLLGEYGDDRLLGDQDNDTLNGGGGNDVLLGGAGADRLIGESGIDRASYYFAKSEVTADLALSYLNTGEATGDTYESVENLTGSKFDDVLSGDDSNNVLLGERGNDTLNGRGGDDILQGGVGADRLIGGSGIDRVSYYLATSRVIADLGAPNRNIGQAKGDTYESIENLTGSTFDDHLSGDDRQNVIWSSEGYDVLDGAGGDDILLGELGDDRLLGGLGSDILDGGDGNDVLLGGAQADALIGGAGVDAASYYLATSRVIADLHTPSENRGEATGDTYDGVESLTGSTFGDALIGDGESNKLRGSKGDDILRGGAGADVLLGNQDNDRLLGGLGSDILDGGDGNDVLLGGAQADALIGGAGVDAASYYLATSRVIADLHTPSENRGEATGDTYDGVESLTGSTFGDALIGDGESNKLRGSKGDDILRGGAGADVLLGNQDNDRLLGGLGSDILDGGDGNDVLLGGAQADALIGGAGVDAASYYLATSRVIADLHAPSENRGEATGDTYDGVESLTGSTFGDALIGDGESNKLRGSKGDDILRGGAGADVLLGNQDNDRLLGGLGSDILDGGDGNDVLLGGAGIDTFVFDGGRDFIEDFNGDFLNFASSLWGGTELAPQDILAFATVVGADTIFDFGIAGELTLQNYDDLQSLETAILTF